MMKQTIKRIDYWSFTDSNIQMIDTIKFKIRLFDTVIDEIKFVGYETKTIDKFYGFTTKDKVTDKILIPPYSTNLSLFVSEYDPYIYYLEGSIPKQVYGENVHLLYPSQLEEFLQSAYRELVKRYKSFPHYDQWFIQRLDMCYAWKFINQETAQQVLDYLKPLEYPRKNKHIYKTTLFYTAKSYSVKLYLKKPEFLQSRKNNNGKSDYKTLVDGGFPQLAEETLKLSEGVLRLEVECRKSFLNQIFKKTQENYKEVNFKGILSIDLYFSVLNQVLNTLFGTTNRETITLLEGLLRLEKVYDKKTVKILFTFLHLILSKSSVTKLFLKKYFDATTIKRSRNKLTEAKVGLVIPDFLIGMFNLYIPSPLVVNEDKIAPRGSGGQS